MGCSDSEQEYGLMKMHISTGVACTPSTVMMCETCLMTRRKMCQICVFDASRGTNDFMEQSLA